MKKGNSVLKRLFPLFAVAWVIIYADAGCRDSSSSFNLPENYNLLPDTSKVALLMNHVAADSLARYICESAISEDTSGSIKSINEAVLYAYINYPDSLKKVFGSELDNYTNSLPVSKRVKLYYLAGKDDPIRLGYKVGKEYVASISDTLGCSTNLKEEIKAYNTVSKNDSSFMDRFMTGLSTALNAAGMGEVILEIKSNVSDNNK